MYYRIIRIKIIVIVLCGLHNYGICQEERYDYINWPGKNGIVKNSIELPLQQISTYNLSLADGSRENSLFYKISLEPNDLIKKGRFQIEIFASIKEAQLALIAYLDCLTTPYKPPRLHGEDFKLGDVAFGEANGGILRMAFIRNNVLLVIHAPLELSKEVGESFDKNIQNAPEWTKNTLKPSFIFPK